MPPRITIRIVAALAGTLISIAVPGGAGALRPTRKVVSVPALDTAVLVIASPAQRP